MKNKMQVSGIVTTHVNYTQAQKSQILQQTCLDHNLKEAPCTTWVSPKVRTLTTLEHSALGMVVISYQFIPLQRTSTFKPSRVVMKSGSELSTKLLGEKLDPTNGRTARYLAMTTGLEMSQTTIQIKKTVVF